MKKTVCILIAFLLAAVMAFPACAARQDPVLEVAPEAVDNLSLDDEIARPLVTPGVVSHGTLVYSLTGNEDDFSETIPTTNDVKGPGIYPVYYKITGDELHNDVPTDFVPVSIGAAVIAVPLSEEERNELTADWGNPYTKTGQNGTPYTYWVDDAGTTSALVTDEDIIWLYEESVDHFDSNGNPVYTSAWFGLSNPLKQDGTRLFREGSRFWVSMLRPFSDKWNPVWNNIDPATRQRLNAESLSFVDLHVTDPDGNEYRDLNDLAQLYIQHDDAVPLTLDENVAHIEKVLPLGDLPVPEAGRYAVLLLDHFGDDYFIAGGSDASATGSVITGKKTTTVLSVCIVAAVLAAAVTTVLVVKKKRKAA